MIYCVVPPELADELMEPLREHYAGRPDVTVIEDRRAAERRSGTRARRKPAEPDRRAPEDRRGAVVPRQLAHELPDALAEHSKSLRWEQRLPPVRRELEDTPLAALLQLGASGDEHAMAELYWRYFPRVSARFVGRTANRRSAERATQQAFGRLFDRLSEKPTDSRSFSRLLDAATAAVVRELR